MRLAKSETATLRRLLATSLAPAVNCGSVPSTPLSSCGVGAQMLMASPAGRLVTAAGRVFSAALGAMSDPPPTTAPAASTAARLKSTAPVFLRVDAVAASLLAAARALSSFLRRALTCLSVALLSTWASVAWAFDACSSLAASATRIFSSLRRRFAALAFSGS